nr:OB-fold-containig protein [Amaricoccus macauensis]
MPALPAAVGVSVPALFAARRLARGIGRLVPRIETSAISERSYGRRAGVVTTGVSRRGYPAEVRFTDGHGTQHYVLAEPLDAGDEIPAGAEVAVIRLRTGEIRIVRTDG